MPRYEPKPGDAAAGGAFLLVCLLVLAVVGLLLARGTAH